MRGIKEVMTAHHSVHEWKLVVEDIIEFTNVLKPGNSKNSVFGNSKDNLGIKEEDETVKVEDYT